MRIVFMGTPDYSVKTLIALKKAGHDIVAVFAQPDKPVGRKQILTPPPTKVFALENGIPVHQPNSLRDGEAFKIVKSYSPDVIVVVAYGKIIPKEILEFPKYGCINGHASLLPKLRGASPIQWAIVTGEEYTGVTTMAMDEGMDTGDILDTVTVKIGDSETAEELFERLSTLSADLMVLTLMKLQKGDIKPVKQDENAATYAPIIKKEMAHIDFNNDAKTVFNAIRGYYSWPCAFFALGGKRIKVIEAEIFGPTNEAAGTVFEKNNDFCVSCGNNTSIKLIKVQPEGKQIMSASDMLRGNKNLVGQRAE